MSDYILEIPFEKLTKADFYVDAVYKGDTINNLQSEVLSKLMVVGNAGGFRKRMIKASGKNTNNEAYVCVYTTGEELEWRDEIDRTLGRFTYWGDNRSAGNPIEQTKVGGNIFLKKIFEMLSKKEREKIAPIFVFQKYVGRDVQFLGLAVPGDGRINPQEALVSIWAQNNQGRYQNYKALFTILDIPVIKRQWLQDLIAGDGISSEYAPPAWLKWIKQGAYIPLITEKNPTKIRTKNEQLPELNSTEYQMLRKIIEYFDNPYKFEGCASKVVQLMDSKIVNIETTRSYKDGGRDAIGKYRVGPTSNGIELDFALEAKKYNFGNKVGVKETSRLISRIKHREFGIIVTTSYVADQAYKEIIEDAHPIIIISGRDIIDILVKSGINTIELLTNWLEANFG